MHSWNNTCCIKHGMKHKVHQVQRKQIDSHDVCSKAHVVIHKLASVLAIGQLYHQSATAPRCNTQLRDVRGLPLPVRSRKPVSCTFLNNFLVLIVSRTYQEIHKSVAEHRSLKIPISFKSKLCLLQYHFEIFTSY